jgi:hypothetical protein
MHWHLVHCALYALWTLCAVRRAGRILIDSRSAISDHPIPDRQGKQTRDYFETRWAWRK